MNHLVDKPVKFQRSTSVKLNPEQEKIKILKDQGYFDRQFSFKTKNLDLPSKTQILNTNLEKVDQSRFIPRKNITNKLFKDFNQNNQKQKSNKNSYNPFDHLTDSLVKKPNVQSIKMQQNSIDDQAQMKNLEYRIETLTQQLFSVKLNKQQIEKDLTQKNVALNFELSETKMRLTQLKLMNFKLVESQQKLKQQNIQLKSTLQKLKKQSDINEKKSSDIQNDSQKFRLLGKEFEKKINALYSENYILKNNLTSTEGKLQQSQALVYSLKKMNESLQKRFAIYQEQSSASKKQLRAQNQKIKEQNLTLREQIQKIQSEIQLQTLRFENQIDKLNDALCQRDIGKQDQKGEDFVNIRYVGNNKKLNQIIETLKMTLKEQIDETYRLRQKNKKLTKILTQSYQ